MPVGILAARRPRAGAPIVWLANVVQTIPSLAMFGFLLPLPLVGGLGARVAIFVLILYALLPIIRTTVSGIRSVDRVVVEAATALGMTERQILWQVQLPLALPSIVAGIRVASVIGVGTATIAAAVGAGGLGEYIFRGLSMVDPTVILAGAVPAAVLALAVDGTLLWLSAASRARRRRRTIVSGLAAVVSLILLAAAVRRGHARARRAAMRVGSKNFTEQIVLGEILAQTIERHAHVPVERRLNLGGTFICDRAVRAGDIDVYVEYTGTADTAVFKNPVETDPPRVFARVRDRYAEVGLTLLPPLGFENTFAILVRGEDARRYGLKTIDDAVPFASTWRAGFGYEFLQRRDGYPGLAAHYGLRFATPPRAMDLSLIYRALAGHQVDLIAGDATSGLIAAYDLVMLATTVTTFRRTMRRPLPAVRRSCGIPRCARRSKGSPAESRSTTCAVSTMLSTRSVAIPASSSGISSRGLNANARLRDDQEMASQNSFQTRVPLRVGTDTYQIFSLPALEKAGFAGFARLPFSLKILLENLLRREDGRFVDRDDIQTLAQWDVTSKAQQEIAFMPARVLLQDFTGVPAVVDLAAMRDGVARLGGDPKRVNPLQPVELVIDHSVQVDHFAERNAFELNAQLEFSRNKERYALLRWGQTAFDNFRVVPPDTGIVHQVNLEYLARVVFNELDGGQQLAYPDTLVGTDSHTTMVNGLGVVGWGVGGIEAEAAMLGQPISMLIPEVVGFRLTNRLPEGATATDLVLTITERLRKVGVVGKFVEFYGPGLEFLTIADRATLGNMSPEYGATIAICPIDEMTLDYLRLTARDESRVRLVEAYAKEQGLFRTARSRPTRFTRQTVELDLSTVEPSLAGPKRPQDRVSLRSGEAEVPAGARGDAHRAQEQSRRRSRSLAKRASADTAASGRDGRGGGEQGTGVAPGMEGLDHGAIVVAAITSCTNTSNPSVMIGAGLVARNAVQRGLKVKPWVKTSLAPGSMVVTEYLRAAGLLEYLAELGFNLVGYGCTTCIGNSGPLPEPVSSHRQGSEPRRRVGALRQSQLRGTHPVAGARELPRVAAAGRRVCARREDADRPHVRADRHGFDGAARAPPGHLAGRARDPGDDAEVRPAGDVPRQVRRRLRRGRAVAHRCRFRQGERFNWEPDSTYIRNPPFFDGRDARADAADRHSRRPRAGAAGRQRDDGSHLAGRIDSRRQSGGEVSDRAAASRRATSTRTAPAAAITK